MKFRPVNKKAAWIVIHRRVQKTKQSAPNTYQRSQKDVPQNLTGTRYLPETIGGIQRSS